MPTDSGLRMSSIRKHTDASSSEAEFGRIRDGERPSPLSEVVVASADPGTRPVTARASLMAATEALLDYSSGGLTDNDCESIQWGSAGQTEAIVLGDRGRLQFYLNITTILSHAKLYMLLLSLTWNTKFNSATIFQTKTLIKINFQDYWMCILSWFSD